MSHMETDESGEQVEIWMNLTFVVVMFVCMNQFEEPDFLVEMF